MKPHETPWAVFLATWLNEINPLTRTEEFDKVFEMYLDAVEPEGRRESRRVRAEDDTRHR